MALANKSLLTSFLVYVKGVYDEKTFVAAFSDFHMHCTCSSAGRMYRKPTKKLSLQTPPNTGAPSPEIGASPCSPAEAGFPLRSNKLAAGNAFAVQFKSKFSFMWPNR